jgi:putative membrane protein
MWHDWDDMGLWGWLMMGVGGLLWIVVVVAVVVLAVRYVGDRQAPPPAAQEPSALELLDRRLARGEIDVDDYERRRDAMRAGGRG